MKVTTHQPEPGFKPIMLNILIESQEELANLYLRFNTSTVNIRDCVPNIAKSMSSRCKQIVANDSSSHMPVWEELSKITKERISN